VPWGDIVIEMFTQKRRLEKRKSNVGFQRKVAHIHGGIHEEMQELQYKLF
jgi:hypothetical protein